MDAIEVSSYRVPRRRPSPTHTSLLPFYLIRFQRPLAAHEPNFVSIRSAARSPCLFPLSSPVASQNRICKSWNIPCWGRERGAWGPDRPQSRSAQIMESSKYYLAPCPPYTCHRASCLVEARDAGVGDLLQIVLQTVIVTS